ncbi:MAG: cyclic nucleotide-binding domain-containing protein [Bacteroidetes bacterium]|nr:cyclic nucleotide-binding domain-containing protein [Bacteroidota bacterium]
MKFDDRFLRITWGILIAVITTLLAFVYPSYIVFNYFSATDLIWIEAAVTAIFLFDIFINDLLKRAWHAKRFSDSSGITSSTSNVNLVIDIFAAVPFILVFNLKILILLRLLKLVRVGEIALFKNVTRNATVRSESYCDLYCLDKENFDFVMNQYPAFALKIEELANQRTE